MTDPQRSNDEPPRNAEELFLAALDQPPARRDAWLVSACGDDADLLRKLRELLRSHDENQDGLLDAITADAFVEQVPTRIGVYNVSRLIDTGGMSAVFDAVHSQTGARTAVKLIRIGLATARQRVRLQIESELLARLNHPGIARLYDAGHAAVQYADGSTAQRMYIAMEYVDGDHIGRFCEATRPLLRDRVKLIVGVARAVQHAHESGVIHRDLKPANILVTADRVPKVVDFGIARLVGSERHVTVTGVVMGTPSYMSPEQMAGKHDRVSTRSDVYSLGAVLYELLTGKPPIEAPSALTPSAAFAMLNADPARAMTRNRDVPRDLDAVVHKALDREPERRYATARELADDLERWLDSRPVVARPHGIADRVRLQVRRRPKLMAGLAVGTLSLLTLGSLAAWQAVVAMRASKVAIEQRDEANRQRAEADRQRDEAVKQSARADREAKVASAVSAFFRDDVLGQANSSAQVNAGDEPDPNIKVSVALDRAAARLDKQLSIDPAVEANIRYAMGQTYTGIGKPREAAEQFKKATEVKGGFEPRSAQMFDARTQFATALADTGREREGCDLLRVIQAEAIEALGEENEIAIVARTNFTVLLAMLTEHGEAIPLMQRNLEVALRVLGPAHTETLSIRGNLAFSLAANGQLAEATKMREDIFEARKASQGANHPQTLLSMNNLARSCFDLGETERATQLTREALAISRKAMGEDHPTTITMMGNLATMLEKQGQLDEALALAREAYERRVRTMGASHPDTLLLADGLIDRLLEVRKPEEAFAIAQASYALAQQSLEPSDLTLHRIGRNVVLCLMRLNRWDEALVEARRTAKAHVDTLGVDSPFTLIAQDQVVQALMQLKRYDEAEPIARDNFERSRQSSRMPAGNRRALAVRFARCLEAMGRTEEAQSIRATTRPSTAPATAPSTAPSTAPRGP
jgi:tetratricopeptide (TPR) repeat protein